MTLKEEATEEYGKALLAIIGSGVAAYLVNLFSTNNHVSKEELGRIPIPDPERLPVAQLAALIDRLLSARAALEQDFVVRYGARLPEFEEGTVYIPPSSFLTSIRLPKLSMAALVGRGEVKNSGPVNGRIRSLRARNMIASAIDSGKPGAATFAEILALFLHEPGREDDTWSQAQNWLLPDPVAAEHWLASYRNASQQTQAAWENVVSLQQQVDMAVADWYGFDAAQRQAIRAGLPWARRQRVS